MKERVSNVFASLPSTTLTPTGENTHVARITETNPDTSPVIFITSTFDCSASLGKHFEGTLTVLALHRSVVTFSQVQLETRR